MILRGAKQLEGPEGFTNDVNLHDENLIAKKELSNPSNDVMNDTNGVP